MNKQLLKTVMERVETWPESDQAELLEYALEIKACRNSPHDPAPEELRAIDEGSKEAREGRVATDAEVEAAFAKFRRQ